MKKFVTFLSMVCLATFGWAATAKEESADRLQKSAEVLTQIAQAPDKGIPEEVLSRAKCVAIVPHPKKELPIGPTRSIIRQSGLPPEDFGF